MPSILQPRPLLRRAACLAALIASTAQADLRGLDNQSLSEITGQAGISIRVDLQTQISQISWTDDGASVSLRNVKIDNGCVTAADCPNGAGFLAFGPAQLGATLPSLGVNIPTLQVDVATASNGRRQLMLTLPDLTTINDELSSSGLAPLKIRVRAEGDLYVGNSRLGTVSIRDITDLRGTIKVWGH